MPVELDEIAKSLLSAVENLSQEDRSTLEQTVAQGNTLVEALSYLLRVEAPNLKNILDPVIDEIFVDIHVAITLAMAKQFKAACVLLRTCIETSLYLVYFVDHPLEAKIWANNSEDTSFIQTLTQVVNSTYLSAASGRQADDNVVQTILKSLRISYRDLSQRVHGKYAFLQATAEEPEKLLKSFADLASDSIKALILLIVQRSREDDHIETEIPAIRRMA